MASPDVALRGGFRDVPKAPGAHPILGHRVRASGARMELLRRLATEIRPLLRLQLPPPLRGVIVNDPDLVHELLVEKASSFDKSDMLRFSLWNLVGEGLFTSNGELWRRQRKLMAQLFSPKAVEAYARDMVACALRTVRDWRDGEELSLAHEATRLTMGVAGKTLFDADTFSEADRIGEALTVALAWTGYVVSRPSATLHVAAKRLVERVAERTSGRVHDACERAASRLSGPLLLWGERGRELARAIAYLDEHVERMIAARRASASPPGDLLARLLAARDDDGAMTDRQVRDEVLTLFVAGHETTATGLAWTLYLASRDPDVYRALQREVDEVGDEPTAEDLPRLGLCLRAFKEALRLYPPVYLFGRDAREEVSIGGYLLPRDANVLTSPWGFHRDPRFFPDPNRFSPDRFLPEAEATRHRFAYLPFGAGPRVCIGNHFAYAEAALVLAVLLRRFDFESTAADEPDPGATLRPRHGVPMRVRARRRVVS